LRVLALCMCVCVCVDRNLHSNTRTLFSRYALLLHNDGYALDSFFACELLRSLQGRDKAQDAMDGGAYVVAAPML